MIDHFALWTDLEWSIIDVETTGLSPQSCRVVEVAVVKMKHGKVTTTFSSLLNPGCPIPAEASRIHGITNADVSGAPRFVDVLGRLCEITKGTVPVAYNEAFDRGFLTAELARLNMDGGIPASAFSVEWPAWLDPLTWVRYISMRLRSSSSLASSSTSNIGRASSNKLVDACARWGVTIENAHRAECDAVAAGALLWKISSDIGQSTVSEVLRRQTRLSSARGDHAAGRQDPSPARRDPRT